MLLIGDIHINSKYKDKILSSLKSFLAGHPEEKNLIFLGDFVYHFSYDRNALLALYDLFLDLYQQGKTLYILAGNHDWLGSHFVFEEARKAFEIFGLLHQEMHSGRIFFITQPRLTEIEGKPICFLPYFLDIDLAQYPGIEALQDAFYTEQTKTGNKNQLLSAKLHLLIQYFLCQQAGLTFIHHYYFDGVAFPGQKSKFSFRDVALSSVWLDDANLQFISGHLHQAFFYKNYLCTGSVWATSPLEENQLKGVWQWTEGNYSFYELGVNWYLGLDSLSVEPAGSSLVQAKDVQAFHSVLEEKFKEHMREMGNLTYHFLDALDLKSVVLSLRVTELNYQKMDTFISPELQTQLQDVKLKKQQINVDTLLQQLQKPDASALKEGFGGWVDLLKDFLLKQYPSQYQEYEQLLHTLKLV